MSISSLLLLPSSPSFPSSSPFSNTTTEEGEEKEGLEEESEGEARKKACSFINCSIWTAAWVLGAREAMARVTVLVR